MCVCVCVCVCARVCVCLCYYICFPLNPTLPFPSPFDSLYIFLLNFLSLPPPQNLPYLPISFLSYTITSPFPSSLHTFLMHISITLPPFSPFHNPYSLPYSIIPYHFHLPSLTPHSHLPSLFTTITTSSGPNFPPSSSSLKRFARFGVSSRSFTHMKCNERGFDPPCKTSRERNKEEAK